MIIMPQCVRCKHFGDGGNGKCSAFPEGIPPEYVWGEIDVEKQPECANGVKFENAEG